MSPKPRLVYAGEALVDLIEQPGDGAPTFVAVPGGAPCNGAIAAARLGTPTAFLSRRSQDRFGTMLEAHLTSNGVDTSLIQVGRENTTLAIATLDDTGAASYRFYLTDTTTDHLLAEDLPMLPSDAALVVTLGAATFDDGAMGSALRVLMRREHKRRLVVLDPNVRAIPSDGVVDARKTIEQALADVDIVKVSDEDLATLDRVNDGDTVARRWLTLGPTMVVVTSADGATAYRATETLIVPTRAVDVVDTVGAGDTFGAGLMTSLLEQAGATLTAEHLASIAEADLTAALRFANSAASIVCTRQGADPPTRAEVDALG